MEDENRRPGPPADATLVESAPVDSVDDEPTFRVRQRLRRSDTNPDGSAPRLSGALLLRGPNGEEVPLDRIVTIGRSSDNDIELRGDGAVSRLHCEVRPFGARVMIVNHSENPIYVNGTPVESGPLLFRRSLMGTLYPH